MPATQIMNVELAAGSKVTDVHDACKQVLGGGSSMKQSVFGIGVENPERLSLFLQGSDDTASEVPKDWSNLKPLLATEPQLLHIEFNPADGLLEALSAPVTEVALFRFDGEPPGDAHANVAKAVHLLQEAGRKPQGWAYGTTHETLEKDGVSGKATMLIAGWESVEAHAEVRGLPVFKEIMPLLGLGTTGRPDVGHVKFSATK